MADTLDTRNRVEEIPGVVASIRRRGVKLYLSAAGSKSVLDEVERESAASGGDGDPGLDLGAVEERFEAARVKEQRPGDGSLASGEIEDDHRALVAEVRRLRALVPVVESRWTGTIHAERCYVAIYDHSFQVPALFVARESVGYSWSVSSAEGATLARGTAATRDEAIRECETAARRLGVIE